MKVLKGSLRETLYCWPCESIEDGGRSSACPISTSCGLPSAEHTCSRPSAGVGEHRPQMKRSTVYSADEVTYMSDRLGLHRVENPSNEEIAVSLHLYTVSLLLLG